MFASNGIILMESFTNQRVLVFLLVSVGLITLPHMYHIPLPLFTFFSGLLIWRFMGIWKPQYLPNKWVVFLLTLAALLLLYTQYQGLLGRDAGTSLFVTALGLKLLEIRRERDLYLINYLAFIVATSQFLYQQSVIMAAYILFVCCTLLATLVSINSYQPKTLQALKTALVIIFQALPITIVLFVLFPRIDPPRWTWFDNPHSAKTGLSDSMEPGAISNLGLSDELVFRVKFDGAIPPPEQRYWRGPVFSHTDGKKWKEPKQLFFERYLDKVSHQGTAYQYTLMMEPQDKNWVFGLDMPTVYPQSLSRNALYQLTNSKDPRKRAEYKISSYSHYNTGYITKAERRDNLQLPAKPSERIVQLVEQLNGFEQSAEEFVQSVLDHFKHEKFFYTLMPPVMDVNPIETFLFETRYGFCGHYATAFVYLMRVAEIPARIVGGYQGGALNQAGGFLEIRQANAHAWAEVWIKGKGWVRVDPTSAIAPERIEQDVNIDLQLATGIVNFSRNNAHFKKALSWMKQAKQLWGTVDYSWQRWVINYTRTHQINFFSALGINDIKAIAYWLVGCIGVITLILTWFVLRVKADAVAEELRLYRLFCQKMATVGLHKNKTETAQNFCARIKVRRPESASKAEEITRLYIRLYYSQYATKDDGALLKQRVTRFKV